MTRVIETVFELGLVVLVFACEYLYFDTHKNGQRWQVEENPPHRPEAQAMGACLPPTTEVEVETGAVWPVSTILYDVHEVTACSSR